MEVVEGVLTFSDVGPGERRQQRPAAICHALVRGVAVDTEARIVELVIRVSQSLAEPAHAERLHVVRGARSQDGQVRDAPLLVADSLQVKCVEL